MSPFEKVSPVRNKDTPRQIVGGEFMSYYFEQKWFQITHNSGRRRMFCVLQESHDGFLGHDWDVDTEAKSKATKYIPRSSVEEMLEVPTVEVNSLAVELRTIHLSSRNRGAKPLRKEADPEA